MVGVFDAVGVSVIVGVSLGVGDGPSVAVNVAVAVFVDVAVVFDVDVGVAVSSVGMPVPTVMTAEPAEFAIGAALPVGQLVVGKDQIAGAVGQSTNVDARQRAASRHGLARVHLRHGIPDRAWRRYRGRCARSDQDRGKVPNSRLYIPGTNSMISMADGL